MKKTQTGRIVYDRPKNKFKIRDLKRISCRVIPYLHTWDVTAKETLLLQRTILEVWTFFQKVAKNHWNDEIKSIASEWIEWNLESFYLEWYERPIPAYVEPDPEPVGIQWPWFW